MAERKGPTTLPHQEEGIRFIRERESAALFDEQGLGKSKQLIDAIGADIADNVIAGALVVCPNTLKTTWAEEIEKHSNLRYAVFGAGRQARRQAFRSLRAQFYVINYEAVAGELTPLRALLRFKRMALVLDESHRIKTPNAKVTAAIHALRSEAAKRVIMTGTPIANKPEDVWSQLFFLDDGLAVGQTFSEFRERYCTPAGGYVHMDDLRERIAGVALRRQKANTIILPEKTVLRTMVPLCGVQLEMYDRMRNDLVVWVKDLSGAEVAAHAENILARLVRLAQLASNPQLVDASYSGVPAKVSALDDTLSASFVDPLRKVIVWSSFVDNIRLLSERYRTMYRPVTIHGEMDGPSRDAAVNAFRTDPSVRLLLANPAAAREGLTLTEADTAVYLDRTFNLVDFLQSQDRIHRLSQARPCRIILLIAEHTIDEFIDFSLAQKHRLAEYAQRDRDAIDDIDLGLQKPDLLRALLDPGA
jgi:SWI/SNF-related matrix-associated actin-dependent regulator of chromatin subfamily A-like protein 1